MAERAFSDRMSDGDTLMWHIEKDPILRSTIVAVAFLDCAPDWRRLRARLERASIEIPRLRQSVVSPPLRVSTPQWVVDPDFDLDFHLRRIVMPAPGTQRRLLDLVAPIAADAFDRARPLWEFTIVEGLVDGRAAVVLKVHHSVTDGVGGMELLTKLVDLERDPIEEQGALAAPRGVRESRSTVLREALLDATTSALRGVAAALPAVAKSATSLIGDPAGTARRGVATLGSVRRTLAPATEPLSPLMRERGLGRRLDVFDVLLDDLKRAAKAANGTLNDAFLTAVVGGLGHYHERHGAEVDELRITMPVNLRTSDDPVAGNQFAPVRFPVPIVPGDPVERMSTIGRLVREWRSEPALALTSSLAGLLNRFPTTATTALFGGMLKCVDFVATNVPGAPVPVYTAGAAVERFYALAPPSGAAVNVSLVSHVDHCCIGIVTDTAAVPDPDNLVADLRRGFDEVLALG